MNGALLFTREAYRGLSKAIRLGEIDIEELKRKIKQAKELKKKLEELGVLSDPPIFDLLMLMELSALRGEVAALRSEMPALRVEVSALRDESRDGFSALSDRLSSLSNKVSWLMGAMGVAASVIIALLLLIISRLPM